MVQINFANKEIQCKVVYYGPGMSGKTTNLEVVHKKAPPTSKGELTSIATEGDRTLFFDFMPLDLGNIAGIKTKFQLYTVPGQVYYNSTRKLVLQGVDGVVFVADSQAEKIEENIEAMENLKANLKEYGRDLTSLPVVVQYNKRDLPTAMTVEELDQRLNPMGAPTFGAVAATGEGVFPTLKTLASLVLESINRDKRGGGAGVPAAAEGAEASAVAPAAPRRVPAARKPVPVAASAAAPAPVQMPVSAPTGAPAAPRAVPRAAPAARPAATQRVQPGGKTMVRPSRDAEPARRPAAATARSVGKVKIKERKDASSVLLWTIVSTVIIGAGAFLAWKFNLLS
jgi:signal recognition particle receptor subunit beta